MSWTTRGHGGVAASAAVVVVQFLVEVIAPLPRDDRRHRVDRRAVLAATGAAHFGLVGDVVGGLRRCATAQAQINSAPTTAAPTRLDPVTLFLPSPRGFFRRLGSFYPSCPATPFYLSPAALARGWFVFPHRALREAEQRGAERLEQFAIDRIAVGYVLGVPLRAEGKTWRVGDADGLDGVVLGDALDDDPLAGFENALGRAAN